MAFISSFCQIDQQSFPLKVHYFLFYTGLACVLPFRTLFAKQLGLSATAVGVIFLAVPFFKIISVPLIGYLTDYFKKFRLIISSLMVVVAVSHLAMLLVPPTHDLCSSITSFTNISDKFICNVQCKEHLKLNVSNTQFECDLCSQITSIRLKVVSFDEKYCSEFSTINDDIIVVKPSSNLNGEIAIEKYSINSTLSFRHIKQTKSGEIFLQNASNFNSYSIIGMVEKEIPLHQKVKNGTFQKHFTEIGKLKINIAENVTANLYEYKSNKKFDEKPFCLKVNCNIIELEYDDAENEFSTLRFWSLFLLLAISSLAFASVIVLMDTVCYEILRQDISMYGYQRLWGTIGWGIGAFAAGYLNQLFSVGSSKINYAWSFYLLALIIILDLIPIHRIKLEEMKYSKNILKDVCLVLSRPNLVMNMFIIFNIGVLSGLLWNYQFWFMEEIGSSQILLGLSQVFECLFAELPCFIISGWVVNKLGYSGCNSLALIFFGFRYLCFSYMTNPWMTLPAALLQGPTFGIFFASMTTYAKTEAPPGTEASVQSLVAASFECLGAGTGSILGGIGIDAIGTRATFSYAAFASFIVLALNILLTIFMPKRKKCIIS